MNFEGFKPNNIAQIPVYSPRTKTVLDFPITEEERKNILEQREKLEKEKQELLRELAKTLSDNPKKFIYKEILDVRDGDIDKEFLNMLTEAVNKSITDLIKSKLPKEPSIEDTDYESSVQIIAEKLKEKAIMEFLNGGNSNEYREIK